MKKNKDIFEDVVEATPESSRPKVYSLYNRPPKVVLKCSGKMVDQSFRDECDINNIMLRSMQTGSLVDPAQVARATRMPMYEDVSAMPESFMDAQVYVMEASAMFDELPSGVRQKFGNNVQKLLEFLADKNNRAEAVELGLIAKDKAGAGPAAAGSGAPAGEAGKPA